MVFIGGRSRYSLYIFVHFINSDTSIFFLLPLHAFVELMSSQSLVAYSFFLIVEMCNALKCVSCECEYAWLNCTVKAHDVETYAKFRRGGILRALILHCQATLLDLEPHPDQIWSSIRLHYYFIIDNELVFKIRMKSVCQI